MRGIKSLLAIVLTLMMLSTFAACGSGSAAPAAESAASAPEASAPAAESTAPAESQPAEVVEISYAHGQDQTPGTQTIVDDFNKKYEGKIKVKFIELPSDTGKQHDQYVTSFSAGGTEYDVFDGDVIWPAEFANAGYSLPLDQYVQRDGVNLDDYMSGPVAASTFKGKLWAMPKFIDAGMFFYRKDIVPSAPATWEDVITQAKANKGKEGTKFGYVAQGKQYEGLVCNAVEFISAYGGAVVDGDGNITINSPETIKGLTVMKEIFSSDFIPNNMTTFQEPESDTAFIEGQSVFIRNWPYQWAESSDASKSKVVGKVAVAALPKGDKRSAACLGGWLAMINKNTKHPDEAWEFLKFVAGPEGQKITAIKGGSAPTIISLYQDPDIQKANPFWSDPQFVEAVKAAVPRPVSPIYPKLSEIMQIEISKALTGQETVEAAVANMDTQMKAAVEAAK